MKAYKKIDVTISKFLKYFVYKLEENVGIQYTRQFARRFNKETEEYDGIAYISRKYILYHNGREYGKYKKQAELLQGMIALRNELEEKIEELEERKLMSKAGESNG